MSKEPPAQNIVIADKRPDIIPPKQPVASFNGSQPSQLGHRFGKAANRLLAAPSRRAVRNDGNLLDAGFLDALDLRAALIDGAGDGEFIDQPIGDDFGVVRLL